MRIYEGYVEEKMEGVEKKVITYAENTFEEVAAIERRVEGGIMSLRA